VRLRWPGLLRDVDNVDPSPPYLFVVIKAVEDNITLVVFAVSNRIAKHLTHPQELDGVWQTKTSKYLVQRPQYLMVMNVRNDKSTDGERVYHVSGLFVDLDPVKVPRFSGDSNPVWVSRELPYPPEFDLEFVDD